MRQYNFKIFPETDADLIEWLDSFGPGRQRSNQIRDALRFYKRSKTESIKKAGVKDGKKAS